MTLGSINAFSIPFIRKEKVGKSVWSFYFVKPNSFSFSAGQYVNITLPLPSGREDTYSFTIASAPHEENIIVTTNESDSLFKHVFFQLMEGEKVKIRGPIGGFTFDKSDKSSLVFLSGGIGITPFRSIILDATYHKRKTPITLFASFAKKEDILFRDELKAAEKNNSCIKVIYTLSQENNDHFHHGRITEGLMQKHNPSFVSTLFGIAGGGEMVDDMVLLLQKMGVAKDLIKTDIFTGL